MSAGAARLAVCVSGAGRTLANLLEACADGRVRATVALVVASGPVPAAELARARGLDVVVEPGEMNAGRWRDLLESRRIEFGVLAGYLRRLPVPTGWEHRTVNIHPALLPSFGGRGMYGARVHEAVLAAGCKVSGCTVHFVSEEYDRGPIIAQSAVPVLDGDTPETLGARVFAEECRVYPRAIADLVEGRLRVAGNRVVVSDEPVVRS
ncbi:MAG: phosphoribosylglycinamide formyltransferase [Phycisphaeraceae bacterium]|nr:phosphoribosylglycinamide formyltransferase [Phycisphaeraceae bacterium]